MTMMMQTVGLLSALVGLAHGLASTDTITWGGDNSRAGYQTNHNMDPSIVGSSQFGQIFKTALPGKYNGAEEQVFSQPLVFTPSDGVQYVYFATTQNNVYKLDAKTGEIVASRNLHIPFVVSDLDGCVDINPLIGITSTGVIDPDTETLYLTAKTYANQAGGNGAQGRQEGRYFIHALDVNDLSEKPNFPVDLEGTVATNNPLRTFGGGIHHQRPALLHSGQFVYAGFASHCVQYNFTGWVIGWDKTTGSLVEHFATEGAGVTDDISGGGVWMSGGGIASDDAGSMFFATGNGYASQLADIPVKGRDPPTSLEEAAVHMTINDDGSLTLVDFFMPWEKQALDGADKDLGTSPLEILPSDFACGDVQRIGVITGKSGKTYWLNLDDLGGYRNGVDGLDAVIQVYQNENSVYAGAGVYPLEGGYIYINVIQFPSHVFKFSCDNGVPSFTKVADTPVDNSYILGVSHGTVTSLDGEPGTGLLWITDVQGLNLRIYDAVPKDGTMTLINSFSIPGTTKFSRPVFGDGIMYLGTTQGFVYGFGSPNQAPLNCSSPVDFGTVDLEATGQAKVITCTALIGVTVASLALDDEADYTMSALPTLPLTLPAGGSFTLGVAFKPTTVGLLSADIVVETINTVEGYSTSPHVRLTGTGESAGPLLQISPAAVTFQGVVSGDSPTGVSESIIISNGGNSALNLSAILYSDASASGPFSSWNGSTTIKVGKYTLTNVPTVVPANSEVTVSIDFDSSSNGNFSSYLSVSSDGGSDSITISGSAGPAPIALIEFQTPDGNEWVEYVEGANFTFGNVTENTSRYLKMRVTNNAPAGAVALSLTVSKAPFGVPGIIGANNQIDLAEGTSLTPGQSATATLYCAVPKSQWNIEPYAGLAQWTMNTNDPSFDKQFIQFACTAITEQAPPLLDNGLGRYRYVGCFKENNPGRQLANQLYGNDDNTNAMCIAACAAKNYQYCGTQYGVECWGGPNIPIEEVDATNCNYACAGNINQICGGNGVGAGAGGAYISLFADSSTVDVDDPDPPVSQPTGPFVNPGVDGYVSLGCYTEATEGRALPNLLATASRTVALCVDACSGGDYSYAGVEYGGECWCGNGLAASSVPADASGCSITCQGNSTEFCGGASRLNVYKFNPVITSTSSTLASTSSTASTLSSTSSAASTLSSTSSAGSTLSTLSSTSSAGSTLISTLSGTSTFTTSSTSSLTSSATPSASPVKPNVGNWAFLGCYTEATNIRALSLRTWASDAMTLEGCASFCSGATYFGTEYGRECYCGSLLNVGSVLAANQNDCSFPCGGDNTETCGAGNRLDVYSALPIGPTSSSTLVSSTVSSSRSSVSSFTSTSATISSSISQIATSSTRTTTSTSQASSLLSRSTSSTSLAVSSTSTTGLSTSSTSLRSSSTSSVISIPVLSSTFITSRTSTTSNPTSTTSLVVSTSSRFSTSSRTTSPSSITTSTSSAIASTSSRVTSTSTSRVTSTTSIVTSTSRAISTSSIITSTSSRITSTSSRSSSTSSKAPVPTGPTIFPGNGNFTYLGCYSEPSSGRLLASQKLNDGVGMTIEKCLATCWMFNYAGVEYGRECWCGDVLTLQPSAVTPGTNVSDSQCGFTCPGNALQYCGAGVRMSLYKSNDVA